MSVMDEMLVKMLQNMTGLTPDEMQRLANNAINLLQTLDNRLKAIEEKLEYLSGYGERTPIVKEIEHVKNNSD